MTALELRRLLDEARERVAAMDAIDGGEMHRELIPGTAATAIESGLRMAITAPEGTWAFTPHALSPIRDAVILLEQFGPPRT